MIHCHVYGYFVANSIQKASKESSYQTVCVTLSHKSISFIIGENPFTTLKNVALNIVFFF